MGHHIIINYARNEEEAKKTLALIEETGGTGELLKFDVGSKEDVQQALGAWMEKNMGTPIQILVNNAGIRKDALMMMMPDEDWEAVIDTNLNSFYHITKLCISGMMGKKWGRIINIVSLSGVKGLPGQTNYSASKAGVIGATKALAQEVGRRGITVNAVAPGFIKTDMTEGIEEASFRGLIPMQRFGEATEVAEAVAFFASPASSYITGEVLNVNGGLYT